MKAWLLNELNGIEQLHLGEARDPTPAAGEAVVTLDFAALNPADRYLAKGEYPAKPKFPHILGRDGVGTVSAVAGDVTSVRVGDHVVILRSEVGVNRAGTFAQQVVVPAESLAAVPAGWTYQQAAAAPLVYLTAWQALTQWGDLPKSIVLISGASGGVGVATTQLAVAAGHTVIGLSRSDAKRKKLLDMGAAHVFDPSHHVPKWTELLKTALGNKRVDLVVDSVGGPGFTDLMGTLGYHGKVSIVGRLAGVVPTFNTSSLLFRRIKVGGVSVGDYTAAESQAAWKSIVELLGKSGFKPLVDSVYPFDLLEEAFTQLEAGPMGKVLIKTKVQ